MPIRSANAYAAQQPVIPVSIPKKRGLAPSSLFPPPSNIPFDKIDIYVLAPHLETEDNNINYYYDFTQSIAEYTKIFEELKATWKWQPVTMKNFSSTIDSIIQKKSKRIPVFLNLCDGDEVNGTPGISVLKKLEASNQIYTGAEAYFYDITTSKVPMKKAFDKFKVPTAKWKMIQSAKDPVDDMFETVGRTVILKPAVSGGSMGVGVKNVVSNKTAMKKQLKKMFEGYRGWDLSIDGIIAEEFIKGREFTTMITGSSKYPSTCKVYEPVERVFHASLPEKEKFLSFDRLWEIYEDETPMPSNESFYEYTQVEKSLADQIKKISFEAYKSVKGTGYTRVDIRMDELTGKLYVLEVNAQCGLSEDEDYTSIGAILKANNTSFKSMILEVLQDAFTRKKIKWD
jgi:D-alanine-D-alanine ligase